MSFQKSDNTAGGLAKLYVLRLINFQGIKWSNDYQSYLLIGDAYNYLEQLYFTQDTGSFKVQRKKGTYHISVAATFPGSSVSFEELESNPFLLVGLTHNNEYLIFGDANNYFIYDHDQDSGSDFSDLNQTAFNLKRQMMLKPKLIREPFIVKNDQLVVPFEVSCPNVNFQDLGSGNYELTVAYNSEQINGGNINTVLFVVGPSNFKEKAFVTFEVKQNFASNLFARVWAYASTIGVKNHLADYSVEYSSAIANEWVTVNLEVWSETPPFNGVYVLINHADAPVLTDETIEIRNIVVKTLP